MKKLIAPILLLCFMSTYNTIIAQETASDFSKRSPIYDYSESNLNAVDSIPDFESKPNQLKITGTIFESDGMTPAKDVLLYIEHADDNGDYQINTENDKRYVRHRGWIKTNADGQYTFYTFVPGSAIDPVTYPRARTMKQIFPVIKESDKAEYNLEAFIFDDDPLLTDRCRAKLKRKGIDNILTLKKDGDIFVATRNITLDQNIPSY